MSEAWEREKEKKCEESGGVWIYAQLREGGVHPVAFELLGVGKRLADELSCRLGAVLIGGRSEEMEEAAGKLFSCGADQVHLVEHELLEDYSTDGYVKAVVHLVTEERPSILIFPGTDEGRDLAPRAAARLKTGLTVDCTELKIEDNRLCQIRPAFGSRLMAEILNRGEGPAMCTARPGMFSPAEAEPGRSGRLYRHSIEMLPCEVRTRVLESSEAETESDALTDAPAVVSGGMGVGGKSGFALLEELAAELGGAVGATRPAAAEGWISHERIIGQTGRIVSPKLYIAVGISGAVQHMLGAAGAKCIVAVNQNEAAPVFEAADYGIVADYREFIPRLVEKLREDRK